MTKTIIFDFDGTLANTKAFAYELYKKVTDQYKVKQFSEDEFDHLKTLSLMDKFKVHNVSILWLPIVARIIRKTVGTVMDQVKPYEGMIELLSYLHENDYKIFIVSSNSKKNIEVFLKQYHIDYIDKIYGRAKYLKKHKVLNKLFKKFKIDKSNAIYVGDETRDIVSCQKIGLNIAAVTWGFDDEAQLAEKKPSFIANDAKNLEKYIFSVK